MNTCRNYDVMVSFCIALFKHIKALSKKICQNILTSLSDKEDGSVTMRVMVNGLPGKMATAVAELIARQEGGAFQLLRIALTGPESPDCYLSERLGGINLIRPETLEIFLPEIKDYQAKGDLFAVDFTQPAATLPNVKFYCQHKIPFILGTTGGDRNYFDQEVRQSEISAVIAPNMAAQVVAFQAMMEYAAKMFPDAFAGFALSITESHQQGKQDTSGTAKAIMKSLEELGLEIDSVLRMVRDPDEQLAMGIPPEHIEGHGWHDYRLASHDGTMFFRFVHNISGRLPYAQGTLKALTFLEKNMREGSKGEIFSMIDVLQG